MKNPTGVGVAVLIPCYNEAKTIGAVVRDFMRAGWRILFTIGRLFKNERLLMFFSLGFAVSSAVAIVLAVPLFDEYLRTGLAPRSPTAILCTGPILLGMILLALGLILDTVTRGRIEAKRRAYLAIPGPGYS